MYIASVSFGKDSLAMLLKLIENKCPLDKVIYFNTGWDYKCIDVIKEKIKLLLLPSHIEFVELKSSNDFDYYMFNYEFEARDKTIKTGKKWCGGGV